jgi:hypothetical protein
MLDALELDPDRDLADRPRDQASGVGGIEEYVRVRAHLHFPDGEDAGAMPLDVFVRVALSDNRAAALPSLLGMDLLSGFRLLVSVPEDRVEMDRLS